MKLLHLVAMTLILNLNPVFASMCSSYLSIAQGNATIGFEAFEEAELSYDEGLLFYHEGKNYKAMIALKKSESALVQSRLQIVTALFQLEKTRLFCESMQDIEILSEQWNLLIEELNLLDELTADLSDLVLTQVRSNNLNLF